MKCEFSNSMIAIAALITVLCSTYVSGACPSGAPSTVVLPYQQIGSDGLNNTIMNTFIKTHLAKTRLGLTPDYAAVSCKQIAELRSSGYYWIRGVSDAVGVYCEMEPTFPESGGWMRIANVDIRSNHSQCPPGLVYNITEGKRLCRTPNPNSGCSSTIFTTQGVEYSKVCGKVIGYQYHNPNGFGPTKYGSPRINQPYVDGVSITHGSPRQHIWTFAAAHDAAFDAGMAGEHTACPCIHSSRTFDGIIPSYVGNSYYCETGSHTQRQQRHYFDDPLWDGEGCEGENECCDRGGPWFCQQLPQPTQDDIELRLCGNGGLGDKVVLEQIKLYVQ